MSSDLPFSSEMLGLLRPALLGTDADGALSQEVGSHLSQPLSLESLFFPTASKIQSKYAAARLSASSGAEAGRHSPSSSGSRLQSSETERQRLPVLPSVGEYNSRLDVLWLQRKAQIERDEGDLAAALRSLREAEARHGSASTASLPAACLDASDMILALEKDVFLFEPRVLRSAEILQRWFRGHLSKKTRLVTLLTKLARGFLARTRFRRFHQQRHQSATVIQRRFRIRLKFLNRCATLIKQWYKIRKIAREFQQRLRRHVMAKRIQKLVRGVWGRREMKHRIRDFSAACTIQRQIRGYLRRNSRSFFVLQRHGLFWKAASILQRWIRKMQAFERSRARLLFELLRENLRAKKEFIIVQELMRVERIKFQFFLRSRLGKLQVAWHWHRLRCKEDVMNVNVKTQSENQSPVTKKSGKKGGKSSSSNDQKIENVGMSEKKDSQPQPPVNSPNREHFVTPEIISIVEMFDDFDDGRVPIFKLPLILSKLNVDTNDNLLEELHGLLDPGNSGVFVMGEFLRWFDSEEADDHVYANEKYSRTIIAHFSHVLNRRRRKAKQEYKIKEELMSKFFARFYLACFRERFPPKFQCCQCLQSFSMFSDYYLHFDRDSRVGSCPVNKAPALFFPRYWLSNDDWRKQREIEEEIRRVNEEMSFVGFWSRSECFEEIESWSLSRAVMNSLETRLSSFFYAELHELDSSGFFIRYVDILVDHIFPTNASTKSNEFIVRMIGSLYNLPIKKVWILEEGMDREETRSWLMKALPELWNGAFNSKPQQEKPKSDHSISDLGSNRNAFKRSTNRFGLIQKGLPANSENFLEREGAFHHRSSRFLFSAVAKVKELMRLLAAAVLRAVRLRIVEARSSLFALMEFRASRPRRITMSDEELSSISLSSLTAQRFYQHFDSFVDVHNISVARYARYKAVELSPHRSFLRFFPCFSGSLPLPEVLKSDPENGPVDEDDVTEAAKKKLFATDEREFTKAKSNLVLHGVIGDIESTHFARQLRIFAQDRLWRETIDMQKLEHGTSLYEPFRSLLLRTLALSFAKYAVLAADDFVESPLSIESWRCDKMDLEFILDKDLGGNLPKKAISQLRSSISFDDDDMFSLSSLHQAAVQVLTEYDEQKRQLCSHPKCFVELLSLLLEKRRLVDDVQDILTFKAIMKDQREFAIISSAPRTIEDQQLFWKSLENFEINTQISARIPASTNDGVDPSPYILRDFRILLALKEHRGNLHHSEIINMLQRNAMRRAWFASRFTFKGRRAVAMDAQLIDIAANFTEALRCLCATSPQHEINQNDLIAKSLPTKTYRDTLQLRLLICSIPAILFDTTCTGVLDEWEERKLTMHFATNDGFLRSLFRKMTGKQFEPHSGNTSLHKPEMSPIHQLRPSLQDYLRNLLLHKPNHRFAISVASDIEERTQDRVSMWDQVPKKTIAVTMMSGTQRRVVRQLMDQALEFPRKYAKTSTFNLETMTFSTGEGKFSVPWDLTDQLRFGKDNSLILRCQFFAARQVKHFLDNLMGKAYCSLVVFREVETLWNRELLSNYPCPSALFDKIRAKRGFEAYIDNSGCLKSTVFLRDSIGISTKFHRKQMTALAQRVIQTDYVSFLRYAFLLHCEPQQFQHVERPMMLCSELNHVVQFIRHRQPNWCIVREAAAKVIEIVQNSTTRLGILWLDWEDFALLIVPLFKVPFWVDKTDPPMDKPVRSKGVPSVDIEIFRRIPVHFRLDYTTLQKDSQTRVYARARQQALLIALGFHDITVPETNYRCLALGLCEIARKVDVKDVSADLLERIPRELVPLYMESQGYDVRDLFLFRCVHCEKMDEKQSHEIDDRNKSDSDYLLYLQKRRPLFENIDDGSLFSIEPQFSKLGRLDDISFPISTVSSILKKCVWQELTISETAKRLVMKCPFRYSAHIKRLRFQLAFETRMNEIEIKGAAFLRELTSGVSHCAFI